jgi:hypothetical protein
MWPWKRRDHARPVEDDTAFLKSASRLPARIIRSEQDGMTNLKPNFHLVLRIDGPDGVYPVETDQYVDYADVKRVAAGRMVEVWFNPAKRDRVWLCPHEIETADAPVDERSDAKFMVAGARVDAKVLSVSPIPQVSVMMPGLPASLWLALRVEAPGGAYDTGACVSSVGIRPLAAGMTIHVWVEPNNHERLALDHSDLIAS